LVSIVLLAIGLRVFRLDLVPLHLGNDEISIAFDTYSIVKTGKDEHGFYLPLSFKSHRTYKAPLYLYVNIPFFLAFGNTEYGIRFLSAMSGVMLVIVTIIMVNKLIGIKAGLIAGFLMAINPRSITVSRIGYEANLAVLIMTLGIWWMYLYKNTQKKWFLYLSGIFLGFSIWGYHTQWGLTPLLALIIPWLWRSQISFKKWIPMWILIILIGLPIFLDFVFVQRKDINNRASSQIWFNDGQLKDFLKLEDVPAYKKISKVVMTPVFNYIDHFDVEKLFGDGLDLYESKTHSLEFGWFFLSTLPLFIIGLWKGKDILSNDYKWILVWLMLCPVVPSLTSGGVTTVRNLAVLVPMTIFMSTGMIWLSKNHKLWTYGLAICLLVELILFGISYFIQFPRYSGDGFQYGYKQALEFIKPKIESYDRVVVEDRFGEFGQHSGLPHLYFGYFKAFDVFEMQSKADDNGLKIGKFTFKYIDWNREVYSPKTVYIVSAINPKAGHLYDKLNEIGLIRNTSFKPQFIIYETRE